MADRKLKFNMVYKILCMCKIKLASYTIIITTTPAPITLTGPSVTTS